MIACWTRNLSRSESTSSARSSSWGFATLVRTFWRETKGKHAIRSLFPPRFDLILHCPAHKIGHGDYTPFGMGLDQALDSPPECLVKLHRDPVVFGGHYLLLIIILWTSYPFRLRESHTIDEVSSRAYVPLYAYGRTRTLATGHGASGCPKTRNHRERNVLFAGASSQPKNASVLAAATFS